MANNDFMAQLQTPNLGLGRLGGGASRGSTAVSPSPGRGFAAMENTMLKQLRPNPTMLAKGKKTRQFRRSPGENFGQT